MQSLWKLNLDWDELLPREICDKWSSIAGDLEATLGTEIDRYTMKQNDRLSTGTTLHVFSDSSTTAYGACAYIVSVENSTLIMAKNRVAPIKTITLPKLELMGALIGARLGDHIIRNMPDIISEITFWSDSQIILSWLSSVKPQRQFIQNRIAEIRTLCKSSLWKYCPTKDNPADLLTRGISPDEFKRSKPWFNGPKWLNNEKDWPKWNRNNVIQVYSTISEEDEEKIETETDYLRGIVKIMDIDRYSSYRKLIRVTAYVLRFVANCKTKENERKKSILSVNEMENATFIWIRDTQREYFKDEIDCIEYSKKRSALVRQLKLFLDNRKLLRRGGCRLDNAIVSYTVKFPYLLPAKSRITKLIALDAHKCTKHSGINVTLAYIQQKFSITKLRQCVKSIISKCVTCRKVTVKPYSTPEMPSLPKERVHDTTPFNITGADFTEALMVRNRNNEEKKTYVCLFTCAVTRAVHLELVPNLSANSFMLCLRRFISRRSVPRIMMSDNSLTFKVALSEIANICKSERVMESIQSYGIEWKFIPNRAPWFGGWWERLIGLTKTSLRKVLGHSQVDEETLGTVLTEIEATLNDRPITYISTDIRDPEPLTPSHLIHGRRLTTLPYSNSDNEKQSDSSNAKLNSQTRRQQQLIEHFRARWKGEYLTQLRDYHQRTGVDVRKINKGDVVLIHDDCKRVYWKLGIVQDTIKGKDDLVRVSMVRTKSGITNRPVTKLFSLEVNQMDCNLRRSDRIKP